AARWAAAGAGGPGGGGRRAARPPGGGEGGRRGRTPHTPADVVGEWRPAGEAEAGAVIDRAAGAAAGWADTPAAARSAALASMAGALEERAGEVTDLVIREVGKPRPEAAGEVARGVAILRYFGQAALLPDGQTLPAASPGPLLMARHRPVGVTGLITPWNFPVAIPLWKAAPSLAFGNAAVLKPAEEAPAVALLLAEILTPHLPPGVFQVVLGAAEAGRALAGPPGGGAGAFTRAGAGRGGGGAGGGRPGAPGRGRG